MSASFQKTKERSCLHTVVHVCNIFIKNSKEKIRKKGLEKVATGFLCGDEMKELLCCPDPSGLGSDRFTVGPNDIKGLWQPKQFYDSMTM